MARPGGNPDIAAVGAKTRFNGITAVKANKKSRQKQNEKNTLKNIAITGLYSAPPLDNAVLKQVGDFYGIGADDVCMAHVILFKQITEAAKGNINAAVFIRDMAGEKPDDNVNVRTGDFKALDAAFDKMRGGQP